MLRRIYNVYRYDKLVFSGINTECEDYLEYSKKASGDAFRHIVKRGSMIKQGKRKGIRIEATEECREVSKNKYKKIYALYDGYDNFLMVGTRAEIAEKTGCTQRGLTNILYNTKLNNRDNPRYKLYLVEDDEDE